MKEYYIRHLFVLMTSILLFGNAHAAAPERIDFGRDVRPILSDKCYFCHGPDEKARKARLRFDTNEGPEGAFRLKGGKAAIVPGKSAESEIVRRILTHDPEEQMPPPKSNRTLSAEQIDILKRWIDQGAKWGVHWAFTPPARPEIPKPKLEGWVKNPIDAFVLARLEKENLKPAGEATKIALIRRVSLDLTGLPPTPAEVDAFVAENTPDAYEKLVDRLLASPRYGERMAADWLDVARYADTHGYQADRYRAMWPWRDWVIKSFNANMPFDQFVTWQLAGDLLPNATKEQRLATAFNRQHMQNEEGGIVEEEFRVTYVVDRVNTVGTALLGLTFECSRCHDHKFDPITQKDFYSMFAFFQNIDESGQSSYFTSPLSVPTLLLSDDAQDKNLAEQRTKIADAQKALEAARQNSSGDAFNKWLANKGAVPAALAGLVGSYSFDDLKNNQTANAVAGGKPGNAVEGPKSIPGKMVNAAELNGENGFTFPGISTFTRADPFTLSLWLSTSEQSPRMLVVHRSKAPVDAGSRGLEMLLENGRVAVGLHHMWPGNSLKVITKQPIALNEWTHVSATYDGSSSAAGLRIYINGKIAEVDVVRDGLWKDITYGGGEPDLAIGYRFRDNGFKGGKVDDFRVFNRALTPLEVGAVAGANDLAEAWNAAADKVTPPQREGLLEYFLANVDDTVKQAATVLVIARREQASFIEPINEIMAMEEMPNPKPAFVLKRGAYDAPGDPVTADTPGFLPPFPKDQPRNRLGLTKWLLDPGQPLTGRVLVNRAWQQMFGHGIVETSENLGSQGSQPTHPELLDWMARSFVDDMHWDMKRLLKTIAMSSTYHQSSRVSPQQAAADPSNVLLARGPSHRLSAEMLRDQSLASGGLLVERLGGPSVKPYQPPGLWDVASGGAYDQGHGDDLHRRSLYTFWKRTIPPPAMMTFDAADRSYCTARRQSTSTPLQALTLLNDPQIVEAARFVSQRMMKEGGATPEQRAAWAFRLITNRAPSAKELPVLVKLLAEQKELFSADAATATKLLNVGEAKNDPALDKTDLAAGTVLAIAIFNHDDAVMKR